MGCTAKPAFQEIDVAYGNDGNDPRMLTVDLSGALGRRAWPIAMIGYVAFRTDSNDYNCLNKRKEMLGLFEYFYENMGYGSNLFQGGFAPLTPQAGLDVLGRVRDKLMCFGQRVYETPPDPNLVSVQVDPSLLPTLSMLGIEFVESNYIRLDYQELSSHVEARKRFECVRNSSCNDVQGGLVILADENLSSYIIRDDIQDKRYELFSMPFTAMATGFVVNFCQTGDTNCEFQYGDPLVLDIGTVALILDRKIEYWNDTAIQSLNPDKKLPDAPINVVAGPKTSNFHFGFIEVVRNSHMPSFSFLGGGFGLPTYYDAWVEVSVTPFSIAFVPFNGTTIEGVDKVDLLSREGTRVSPTAQSIEACARDTYDEVSNVFYLSASQEVEFTHPAGP